MDGYSGDASNAMMTHTAAQFVANGEMFSTADNDNDSYPTGNCALSHKGGWWYNYCSVSEISLDRPRGRWMTVGTTADVEASRMLVKHN